MRTPESIDALETQPWVLPSRRKVGLLCLLATESALFTIFVVAYLFYLGKSLNGPYPKDILSIPWLASVALISSSVSADLAERAFRCGNRGRFQAMLAVTILLGLGFLGATALEWKRLILVEHFTINGNLAGTTFYALVGLHASHVIVGLLLLTVVLLLSLKGAVASRQHERIQMLTWYWHFVDAIWIVVFLVVYVFGR
jgi:cytochrome c oxidase subunit 3/cytochrome o ubiquinol oxidase subunit 3